MRRTLISNKELLVAVFLTSIYIFTGFTPDPLAWPNQVYNRMVITNTIQPENPQIEQLEREFEEFLKVDTILVNRSYEERELRSLETFINSKIPYVTDFNNYFAWEHFPTISDVLERGDDCDGIAIVAASLLIRRGYDCYIVNGKWHSWIEVNLGEGKNIILFSYSIPSHSDWYIKYNTENVYIKGVTYLDIILHNFLLILFLQKLVITLFLFFRRYEAFRTVYATIFALILSPLPALLFLIGLNA
jgi:hypothetical protein